MHYWRGLVYNLLEACACLGLPGPPALVDHLLELPRELLGELRHHLLYLGPGALVAGPRAPARQHLGGQDWGRG